MPQPAHPWALLAIVCLSLAVGAACYGLASMTLEVPLLAAGLAVFATGYALLCTALDGTRHEFATLRQALASVERDRDELLAANEQLRNDNVALRSMDVAFRDVLNLADERSHGQLRILIEQTGDGLAEWLEEQMDENGEKA